MEATSSSKRGRQTSKADQSNKGSTARPSKIKRKINTCARCRERKVTCDKKRPCNICTNRNETHLCVDVEPDRVREPLNRTQSLNGDAQEQPQEDSTDADIIVVSHRPINQGRTEIKLSIEDLMELLASYENEACTWKPAVGSVASSKSILLTMLPNDDSEFRISLGPRVRSSATPTALMFSVLALGAQHSTWDWERRESVTKWCFDRSVSKLRAANYQSNPTLETLQCFLVLIDIHYNNARFRDALKLLHRMQELALVLGIFHGQTKSLQQSHWEILDAMDWQETLISICLQQIPRGLKEPEPMQEPYNYCKAMVQISRKMATSLRSQYLQSLRPADVQSRVHEVDSYFQDLQRKFEISATTTSLLIQQNAIMVHTSHFITHLCQRILVSAQQTNVLDNIDQRDAHSQLFQLCIDKAMVATKTYVGLLQQKGSNIAVRSVHLMHNGLSAAFLLASLGELRRNDHARTIVRKLVQHTPLFNKNSRTDHPHWSERELDRLSILLAKAESNGDQDLSEPLQTPQTRSTRTPRTPTGGSSEDQEALKSATVLPQRTDNEEAHQLAQQLEETTVDRSDIPTRSQQGHHPSHQTPRSRLDTIDQHMQNFITATGGSASRLDFTTVFEEYGTNGQTPVQHQFNLVTEDRRASAGGDSDFEFGGDSELSYVDTTINEDDGDPGNMDLGDAASLLVE